MKSDPPRLDDAQRRFYDRMTGRSAPLEFLEDERRMAVYADGYVARLTAALADTFATCERALGKDRFFALAKRYAFETPSTVYNINRYGRTFPDFLSSQPDAARIPWLASLADLEWRIAASFHAFDRAPIPVDALGKVPPDRLDRIVFEFQPSMQLFHSEWDLRDIFEAYRTRARRKEFSKISQDHLMYRLEGTVHFTPIAQAPASLLRALVTGLPLGEALERSGIEDPSVVFECFKTWPQLNILAAMKDSE